MPIKPSLGNREERRSKLAQVLRSTHIDENCDKCIDGLEKYIDSQLEGDDYLALFPDVALHLDSCIHCSEIYARLYELEVAEIEGTVLEQQSIPVPNLAVLSQKQDNLPIDKITEFLENSLKRSGEIISFQLSSVLFTLLKPFAIPITTRNKPNEDRYSEVILGLSADMFAASKLPFSLFAYRDSQQPDLCLVQVKILNEGGKPNLGGKTVHLIIDKTKRETLTDQWGLASFEGIFIKDLEKVEIGLKL